MGVRDPIQAVVNDLKGEFEESLSHETISALAAEEVRAFEDATVREFVPMLAWRRARRRAWLLAWRGDTAILARSANKA
ncbi:MAG: three-helix bundle dimerization domain-containing protein [Actinomycetota bacterium]